MEARSGGGAVLARLVAWGELRPVDARLAEMLGARSGEVDERVLLAAALASHAGAAGDVCVELPRLGERRFRAPTATAAGPAGADTITCPPEREWRAALAASSLVSADGTRPLVLDAAGRLYLQRYWCYEQRVAAAFLGRVGRADETPDPAALGAAVRRWFPPAGTVLGRQGEAAALVALRGTAVITGGPGTGKTTTLARIVAMLAELHAGSRLRMAVAAPTGKGANRVQAALRAALDSLELSPPARALLPVGAATLHRLLGARRGGSGFRFGSDRPLPLDALFVDEASMVDLRLMAHLLDALPPRAKLVLLGDPNQLASVEAGAVLEELCRAAGGVSRRLARTIRAATGCEVRPDPERGSGALADLHVRLEERHRFTGSEGIGRLADAVRDGDAAGALALLGTAPELRLRPLDEGRPEAVVEAALEGYRDYLGEVAGGMPPAGALAAFARFQLLSPFRHGRLGTEHLNALLERRVRGAGPVGAQSGYPGQPLIVVRNDYDTELFNGDVGVVLPTEPGAELRACFAAGMGEEEGTRALSLARLPACEPAYALTVHKSQGSEFERVMLIVPERERPGGEAPVTRELLYTAITRARLAVEVWASEHALAGAIEARARRASGLAAALTGSVPHPPVQGRLF